MPPHEPENDETDPGNVIIEDEEAEEEDNSCTRVAGSPNSYCFGLEWTEVS